MDFSVTNKRREIGATKLHAELKHLAEVQRVAQKRVSGKVERSSPLPEYLAPAKVEALIHAAPHGRARLVMLMQWGAGLRVLEAVGLAVKDIQLDGDLHTLRSP